MSFFRGNSKCTEAFFKLIQKYLQFPHMLRAYIIEHGKYYVHKEINAKIDQLQQLKKCIYTQS